MSERIVRVPLSTEELFRRHAPFVSGLLYRFGVRAAELDDVLQEVFLLVHRHGGYVPGPATPKSYLASIAIRAAASSRRRDNIQRSRHGELSPDQLGATGPDPVRVAETNETAAQLEAALAQLEPDQRAVLVLVELEGESCVAVAASLRIPVGTVYWRLHRARKRFHETARRIRDGSWVPAEARAES